MQNKKGILIRIGIIAACVLIGLIIAWFRGKGQETKNIFEDTEWSLTKSGDSDIYGITFTADTLNVESKNKQGAVQYSGSYKVLSKNKIQIDFELRPDNDDTKEHNVVKYEISDKWSQFADMKQTVEIRLGKGWTLTLESNNRAKKAFADGCWVGKEGKYKDYTLYQKERDGLCYVIDNTKKEIVEELGIDFDLNKLDVSRVDRPSEYYEDINFDLEGNTLTFEKHGEKTVFEKDTDNDVKDIYQKAEEVKTDIQNGFDEYKWHAVINEEDYYMVVYDSQCLVYNGTGNELVISTNIDVKLNGEIIGITYVPQYYGEVVDIEEGVPEDQEYILEMNREGDELILNLRKDGELLFEQVRMATDGENRVGEIISQIENYGWGGRSFENIEEKTYAAVDGWSDKISDISITNDNEYGGRGYLVDMTDQGYVVAWEDEKPAKLEMTEVEGSARLTYEDGILSIEVGTDEIIDG